MAKMTDSQRIAFAKHVQEMYEAGQVSWRRVLTFSLLKGIVTGFGIFLGGTILVAILLWLLGGLGQIPFLHNASETAKQSLQQSSN